MKKVFSLAIIAVVTAVIVVCLRYQPGRVIDNCITPTECRFDLSKLKKTDTNLLIKAGISYITTAMSNLTALAVDGSNIIVGSRTGVEVLDAGGSRLVGFGVAAPVNCLAVAPGGDILAGLKDHIEVYGQDGVKKAGWMSPDSKTDFTSIAVSSNFVYAADCVNRIIWRFTLSGELLGRIGEKDNGRRKNGFVVPSAFFDVAVAADGSLWVANPGEHRLEHFTADGKFLACWGKAALEADGFCGCCNPSNIAIAPDGSFVTSEKHIVRVKSYDATGAFNGIICGQEEWEKEAVGLDLAVDSKGRILVLDPQADVVRVYARK